MLIPVEVDVRLRYWPYANAGLVAACVLVYVLMACGVGSPEFWDSLALRTYDPTQLLGSMFLHEHFWHLFFNMVFLWLFGNAVCGTIGNWRYLAVYLLGGVAAGVVHLLADGRPAIGASGAINAVLGFYLVLYPLNEINCIWAWVMRGWSVKISGYWLILCWFALNVYWAGFWAIAGIGGNVAYWAHIGGFLTGMAMGWAFVRYKWVELQDYDHPSLPEWLKGGKRGVASESGRRQHFQEEQARLKQKALASSVSALESTLIGVGRPNCPQCGVTLEIEAELAGERVNCPACGKALMVAVMDKRSQGGLLGDV